MRIFDKDERGWQIGRWNTLISIRWRKFQIMRWYGVKFDDKYNTICFGRLQIRVWKPKFMRSGEGIFLYREIPYDKYKTL